MMHIELDSFAHLYVEETIKLLKTPEMKKCLKDKNIELAYETLYKMAEEDFGVVPVFTAILYNSGINPLPHMKSTYPLMFRGLDIPEIVIPENIDTIAEYTFASRHITKLSLPKSLKEVIAKGFCSCLSLKEIIFEPDNENNLVIGKQAAARCIALTTLELPKNVSSIGENAFSSCKNLTTVKYAGTVEEWNYIAKNWQCLPDGVKIQCSDGEDIYM